MYPSPSCTPVPHLPQSRIYPSPSCTPVNIVPQPVMYPSLSCTPVLHVPQSLIYPSPSCIPVPHVPQSLIPLHNVGHEYKLNFTCPGIYVKLLKNSTKCKSQKSVTLCELTNRLNIYFILNNSMFILLFCYWLKVSASKCHQQDNIKKKLKCWTPIIII